MVKETLTPEEAAQKAKNAATRVRNRKTTPEPVQAKLNKVAAYKEPKVKLTKKDKAIAKAKDAVTEAERKLKEEQKKLEEAKRLQKAKDIKKQEKAVAKAKENLRKAKEKLRKAKGERPMDMREAAKRANENEKKRKEAGMGGKDKKAKGKGNTEELVQQKVQEMQKKYENKELPGGLIVKQQGPSWVLVGPNGSKDITYEMESFIKANRAIDKANRQIDANNKVSFNEPSLPQHTEVDKKSMVDNTAKGMSIGQMQDVDKVDVSVPVITDIENKPLDPASYQKLAEVTVDYAMDKNDLESLLEKDKQNKDKQNKRENQHEREKEGLHQQSRLRSGNSR